MGVPDAATLSKTNVATESAAPLMTDEVYQLFSKRSWLWNDGSGYFSAKQRRFIAWTGRGSTGSYAVGRWFRPPFHFGEAHLGCKHRLVHGLPIDKYMSDMRAVRIPKLVVRIVDSK
ncbi:DUF995 domain-containing protein [Mesorhizobium tianshanense]|uniref:DUF995 domain-containing protein n=1 Tax=Mesorhizobium tianshanense TaxID=39844 RepID=UPI0023E87AA0|nr:DUF995 domain-containing protein [Mesorhizobium tianshanense]